MHFCCMRMMTFATLFVTVITSSAKNHTVTVTNGTHHPITITYWQSHAGFERPHVKKVFTENIKSFSVADRLQLIVGSYITIMHSHLSGAKKFKPTTSEVVIAFNNGHLVFATMPHGAVHISHGKDILLNRVQNS